MAPKYYDLTGAEVSYYYPVDALEALELGLITTEGKVQKTEILINCGGPKKEEPTIEEPKQEPPVEKVAEAPAEEKAEAPKRKAPRRRSAM